MNIINWLAIVEFENAQNFKHTKNVPVNNCHLKVHLPLAWLL